MKRRIVQQIMPAMIMAGAAAIPVVTSAEIISHSLGGGTALQPSSPVATLPSRASSNGTGTSATGLKGSGTYQGPVVSQPYGGVQATVKISGKRIAGVVISAPQNNPVSANINRQAVPLLTSETLQAQSGNVNTISGATLTSQAYIQSLQSALGQAGNAPASSGQSASVVASHGKKLSISGRGGDRGGDF